MIELGVPSLTPKQKELLRAVEEISLDRGTPDEWAYAREVAHRLFGLYKGQMAAPGLSQLVDRGALYTTVDAYGTQEYRLTNLGWRLLA